MLNANAGQIKQASGGGLAPANLCTFQLDYRPAGVDGGKMGKTWCEREEIKDGEKKWKENTRLLDKNVRHVITLSWGYIL